MEHLKIKGRAWTFGDNVDTDQMVSGKFMVESIEEQGKHVFEALDPAFSKEFKPGGIIVAGSNFGCGSSREMAPEVLKHIGVAAVVAESFARIFFRNAIAIGLPVLECPHIKGKVSKGDEIEVDLEKAQGQNITTKELLEGLPLNEMILASLKKGGIMKLLSSS
jgi:3-isopropylmalate/(R)-2-methylmalate dehydratase small subunit